MNKKSHQILTVGILAFFGAVVLVAYTTYSIFLNTTTYILSGILVFRADRANREPLYFGPGTVFWMGHFLCWVIGGYLIWLFQTTSASYNPRLFTGWKHSLAISSASVGFFSIVYYAIKKLYISKYREYIAHNTYNENKYYQHLSSYIDWRRFKFIFLAFVLIAILKGTVDSYNLLRYITDGFYKYSRFIVYPLVAISILDSRIKNKYTYASIILAVVVTLYGIVRGGRGPFLILLFTIGLSTTAKYIFEKRVPIIKIATLALSISFVSLLYFQTSRNYRSFRPGSYSIRSGRYSYAVMAHAFRESVSSADIGSIDFYARSLRNLGHRLYEKRAGELLYYELTNNAEYGTGIDHLVKDFAFQYIPSTIYSDKGKKRGQYILRHYGIVGEYTSAPITTPIDAYYRFGFPGILVLYSLYAVILSALSNWLLGTRKFFAFYVYLVILIFQLRMYTMDSLGLLMFYTSDIFIMTFISAFFMGITGFVNTRDIMRFFRL